MQPRSFGSGPCPDRRFQSDARRVWAMSAAVRRLTPTLAPGSKYMRAADPQDIAFACATQLLFDVTIPYRIACNPLEWDRRGHGACSHSRPASFGLVAKPVSGGHVCGFLAIWIIGPFGPSRKIQRAVDESMTVARNVGREDADLAVRDLARRASVLTRYAARRLALFEKAGLIDHEDRVIVRQMLDDIIADDIAQGIRIPIPATQDRLLPPWAEQDRLLPQRASNRSCVARLQAVLPETSQHSSQHALLPEQWTYPLLDLPKRRRPQRKRLFNIDAVASTMFE